MNKIKEILHKKRKITEGHIKKLREKGEQKERYTAMMPDIPFMVLGLICDIGWIIHLVAGIVYFCKNGFRHATDYVAVIVIIMLVCGVACIVYLNKIHEKEIATSLQKNLSFGMTAFAGLLGTIVGIVQIATYAGVSVELILVVIGGFLNFITCLPIYLSFKKGIFYGVK